MGVWPAAVVAGLVAGIAMGAMLDVLMGLMPTIGALVSVPTVLGGWILHLLLSVGFALLFVAFLTRPSVGERFPTDGRTSIATTLALGAAYGVVLWFVAAGVVMPLWMDAAGLAAPSIPNLSAMGLVGHLVYGIVLGGGYVLARSPAGRSRETATGAR